ncbi:ABC transporter substrate-binding protein [Halorubrum sp. CGM5_25_10-8B]|uniref:ABC transporter substrate-binding protein n=1 Tax=Halorubrum sp. CGM5_25_10-8B TaxID=2518115 RepID=UPI00130DA456|nr:ABC transporter substrate-binding protein [Halorubrum sp. CGM5_25_10-8B]
MELDPVNNNGGNYSIMLKNLVYSPVLGYDRNTNLVPILAEEIPTLEGNEFTLNLDADATFHNGDAVTAEDVKYTFEATVEEQTSYSSNFSVVDTIEVEDEQTAHFTLNEPYVPILHAIAHPVAPKSVREEDPEGFGIDTFVGSGPFEVTDFEENDHVTMVGWDDYWGSGSPNLDEVRFTPINEPTNRVTQLQTGEQDAINRIPPQFWSTIQEMPDADVIEGPSLSYQFAAFNQNEGECAKRDVRLAIDHCVDLDQAIDQYIKPGGGRIHSPLPASVAEAWDMPLDEWTNSWAEKDIDRAQELFESAGVPDDWTCNIIVSSTEKRRQVAVSISNGIQEAGYDAQVQYLDFATMLDRFDSGDASQVNIYLLGWTRAPEPDRFMYELLHMDGAFQGQYYDNERFNELLAEARVTTDREQRREMYIEAIDLFIEDRVHLPLYYTSVSMGVKDYVERLKTHPVTTYNPYLYGDRNNTNADTEGSNVWMDQ